MLLHKIGAYKSGASVILRYTALAVATGFKLQSHATRSVEAVFVAMTSPQDDRYASEDLLALVVVDEFPAEVS